MEAIEAIPCVQTALSWATKVLSITMNFNRETHWQTFWVTWGIHFLFSWIGFTIYMQWDYSNYKQKTLDQSKLPTRHPLKPFWYEQLKMVPLVLYNQLVVWPLTTILIVHPIWEIQHLKMADWWLSHWYLMLPAFIALMVVSDFMWYSGHRFMHVPYAWKHWHKMHHIAPQSAISATYVHPVEYAIFCFSMQMPFACTGMPYAVYCVPLAWGMLTGCGAHSGYSGDFANGDKHNAHHLYHNVNFGLLMIADAVCGTHWNPGDPQPRVWKEAVKIWEEFPDVQYGEGELTNGQHPEKISQDAQQKKIFNLIKETNGKNKLPSSVSRSMSNDQNDPISTDSIDKKVQ